ncbi:DUF4384 domain-containing protein [Azospirillum sp. B510]|uniref:DUF4384 domain-containing protein n=1 Tax=Azospirillum sp. (strain B510) TaxID=137722 RepID=UPI0002DFF5CA|nr:DUF4384 domain-containing protein [Azospirillum sp. B510]
MRRGKAANAGAAGAAAAGGAEGRLGRFRLLDPIGRDGDVRQHLALDGNGQAVSLWTAPLSRLCNDTAGLERFRRTAAAAGRLSHPAIPAILASGEHGGIAFVASALVEGPTLAERLASGPLDWEETVSTLDRVLDALATAHRAGILHGALGPEAVRNGGPAAMVTGFGRMALSVAPTDAGDDLAGARLLVEALLAGHEDRPAAVALLTASRTGGDGAFPDAAALRRAVARLTGEPAFPALPPQRSTARVRRWPLWGGGAVLVAGALAVGIVMVAVSDSRPAPLSLPLPLPPAPPSATTTASEPIPALRPPEPPAPRGRPPVEAVTRALRAIPCALITVEMTGGRLLTFGTVAGGQAETDVRETVGALAAGWEHGFDLAVADDRFCAPLSIAAAALDANRGLAEPLTTEVLAGVLAGPALNAGDALTLEIKAPAHPVRVQVDYFTVDGTVIHLLPNPSDGGTALDAGASRRLGDKPEAGAARQRRFWTIGPPYGIELLLTIATAAPLFPAPRPEQEPAADYLAALADALAAMPEDAVAALADARFIATGP